MTVRQHADAARRRYITPEDVAAALAAGDDPTAVRLEVLGILGQRLGAEDLALCAYVAWRGTSEPGQRRPDE